MPVTPPSIPTGQELYDAIMRNIEPELTSAESANLEKKYQGETPDQKQRRMQRYQLALDQYDRAYSEYIETLQTQVTRYKKQSLAEAEVEDRARDENLLGSIAQAFLPSA